MCPPQHDACHQFMMHHGLMLLLMPPAVLPHCRVEASSKPLPATRRSDRSRSQTQFYNPYADRSRWAQLQATQVPARVRLHVTCTKLPTQPGACPALLKHGCSALPHDLLLPARRQPWKPHPCTSTCSHWAATGPVASTANTSCPTAPWDAGARASATASATRRTSPP